MEMKKIINYGLHDLVVKFFQTFGSDEADLIELVLKDSEKCLSRDFKFFYDLLVSEKVDYFYFTLGCRVTHLFTRSTRPGVLVQDTSFVPLRDGTLAPSSHKNIYSFEDVEPHDDITIFAA